MVAFGRLLLCEFVKKQDFRLKRRYLDVRAPRGVLAFKTSDIGSVGGVFYQSI